MWVNMNRREFLVKAGVLGAASSLAPGLCVYAGDGLEGIPFIDTHLHLWDRSKMDYPWLSGVLDRDFLPTDFKAATRELPVSKMVFVECGRRPEQYLQEVDWVLKMKEEDPRIQGMVAYFPLERGFDATEDIELLVSKGIIRGIRKGFSEELVGNKAFLEGMSLLRRYDLSFDVNVSPLLMEASVRLVRAHPDLTFILNHLCNPDIHGGRDFDLWKRKMVDLGKMENVMCKVSGIITKANLEGWKTSDLLPYLDHAFEVFGTERLVFGGDWPVVLRAGSYKQWADVFLGYTAQLSQDEKESVYYRNAERIYRI